MPKNERGASGTPLTAAEATRQITGLITEVAGDDIPETTDAPAEDAAPDQPTGPETPPPAETSASDDANPESYEVTVDGEVVQVDLAELKSSYSYQQHNTKRAQELDARLKAAEQDESERTRALAEYTEGLKGIREALEQIQGEPDWAERRRTLSAEEFLKEKADWEASKASTDKLRAKEQELRQQQAQDEGKKFQAYVRAEQDKLRAAVPDFADEGKARAEAAKLRAHARTYGFSDKEIDGVVDHRTILLLRDAAAYAALKREPSEKAKAKTPAIRTARPGAGAPPPAPNARQQQLMDRALQSRKMQDIARAVETLID